MPASMLEKIAKAIEIRDSTDSFAIARAVLEAMKEPDKDLLENVMQSSLDYTPIMHCKKQALKVWQNTINAILKMD